MASTLRYFTKPKYYEQAPRFYHGAAPIDDRLYLWGGRTEDSSESSMRKLTSVVEMYDPYLEMWEQRPTTGVPPPGLYAGGCTSLDETLLWYGGHDGKSFLGSLHQLNTVTLNWDELHHNSPSQGPMAKHGCGLVSFQGNKLGLFGGYGVPTGPTQPGSTFTRNTNLSDGSGWTNEFHLFHLQEGVWSSPPTTGSRPPPCAYSTFTAIDSHRAVLFGGVSPGHGKMNDAYIFNIQTMHWSKLEKSGRGPWPVGRAFHAACCLNYGEEHPQLLVSGGLDKDGSILKDLWVLDVETGTWKELAPPDSVQPRFAHTVTAVAINPSLVEVTMFGGCPKEVPGGDDKKPKIAETTVLQLESVEVATPGGRPPTREWVLVGVAKGSQLGSPERLRAKLKMVRKQPKANTVATSTEHGRASVELQASQEREMNLQARITTLSQRATTAEERATTAEERATAADERATTAEERATTAEERANTADERATAAGERANTAEERANTADERATAAGERANTAEERANTADERATAAGERANTADERATTAEERATTAEERATTAEERANTADERATAAGERANTAEERANAAGEGVQEAERMIQDLREAGREANRRAQEAEQRAAEAERRLEVEDQPFWAVDREEIQFTGEELGKGGWAEVKVAKFRAARVAAKCLHSQIISPYNRDLFIREMNVAARVRHPNLLLFVGATLQGELIILTELMPTSLRALLKPGKPLIQQHLISIASDVAKALNYLHLMTPDPIIHRDVSSANVLLDHGRDNTWKAKLSDYGSANFLRQLETAGPGNPTYAAPEANLPAQQSNKMDIFSFGVLLVEMCTARFPDTTARERLIRSIREPSLVRLVRECIAEDKDRRPSAAELVTQLTELN